MRQAVFLGALLVFACTPPDRAASVNPTWHVEVDTNRIDGSTRILVSIRDTLVRDSDGLAMGLILACAGNDGIVSMRATGGTDSDRWPIRYRLDDGPIKSARWYTVRGENQLMEIRPKAFLRELLTARSVTIEDSIHAQSGTFDLAPFRENQAFFRRCIE